MALVGCRTHPEKQRLAEHVRQCKLYYGWLNLRKILTGGSRNMCGHSAPSARQCADTAHPRSRIPRLSTLTVCLYSIFSRMP